MATRKTELKKVYVYTIGCQMNVYDSERMVQIVAPLHYEETRFLEEADLVLVNTCSVREKAEQKAFSFLGRLAVQKRGKKELIIGVGGCVAQQEGERIFKRAPAVDLVFGTHAIPRLPRLVSEVEKTGCRMVDIDFSDTIHGPEGIPVLHAVEPPAGFVTIMRGCDNFCTYCVVPFVRGRECSRPPEEIVAEISARVQNGMREVTLLGQNVNSYGIKEGLCPFSELLGLVNAISGLERIRFTTSHPKDLSDELITAFRDLDKLCNHIHLPVQSGSDRILKRMNRRYTREMYIDRVGKLRQACPSIAISSDMIVGFPGETVEDFEQTLEMMREVAFDSLFAFVYSDRPHAKAASFPDKVAEAEKRSRLLRLLDFQETHTREKNQAFVGKTVEVLVEGLSKKQGKNGLENDKEASQWSGRTTENKIVNFEAQNGNEGGALIGNLVRVYVERAFSHSLQGRAIAGGGEKMESKGDDTYAA